MPADGSDKGLTQTAVKAVYPRSIPVDFVDVLKVKGSYGASRHYRVSLSTVTEWRHALDIPRGQRMVGGNPFRIAKPRSQASFFVRRAITMPEMAADFLRGLGPVSRCDKDGKLKSDGLFWRRGISVMTDEEIVAKAKRLGFVDEGF